MLPAFPKIEKLVGESSRRMIDRLAAQRSPIGMVDRHVQFEGKESAILRHDDSIGESPLYSITAEVKIERTRLDDLGNKVIPEKMNALADQIARRASEQFYAQLDREIEKVGNVIDAGGEPFGEEQILKALEKMEHSFEPDGTWNPPTLVVGSAVANRLMQLQKENPNGTPEFNESLSKILEKKRDDFRRREDNRVLAG